MERLSYRYIRLCAAFAHHSSIDVETLLYKHLSHQLAELLSPDNYHLDRAAL